MHKSLFRLFVLLLLLSSHPSAFAQNDNPASYSDFIPLSSGLPFDAKTDVLEHFLDAKGRAVEVLVKGPQGTGTYSRAIRANETPDVYFPAVVSEAIEAKAHHLVIPKSIYVFKGPELCTDAASSACNQPTSCNALQYYNCPPFWTIGTYPEGQVYSPHSITDLDIDFSGSELDFNAPVIGIEILETARVRLRNLVVDWPDLPIGSLGTIVADPDNRGHNALVLDAKYAVEDKYRGGSVHIEAVDPWDDSSKPAEYPGHFDANSNNNFETYFIFGGAPQPTYVGRTSAGEHTFSCKSCNFENSSFDPTCSFFNGCANFDGFALGSRVIVRHYTYNGIAILVYWSNDVTFENVTLRTAPGVGFSLSNNGGYRGFRLARSKITRAPGRVLSTASDAVDLAGKADFLIEDNEIGYQGDDSMNIYTTYASVTGVQGATITTPVVCSPDPYNQPVVGDHLAFFDANMVYLGSAQVTSATGAFCGVTLTLKLNHAVTGLDTNSTLLDLAQQPTARYLVRNNYLHDCRCHGALVSGQIGEFDHNRMFGNTAGALGMNSGAGQGLAATNLSFIQNVVTRTGKTSEFSGAIYTIGQNADGSIATSPVFESIKIADNIIANVPGPAVVFTATRGFTLESNRILHSNDAKYPPYYFGALPTTDSILAYTSRKGTICGTSHEGASTGPVGVDSSSYALVIEGTCNGLGKPEPEAGTDNLP